MSGTDWRHHAECRDEDPELWFPIGNTGPAIPQIEEAKAVCRRCGVIEMCLTWALDTRQDHGVWGGLSEDERRSLRRRESRARAKDPDPPNPPPKPKPKPRSGPPKPRSSVRPELDGPDRAVPVDASTARGLIVAAREAGMDTVRIAALVGSDRKWVSSVATGTKGTIALAYHRQVVRVLAKFAEPGADLAGDPDAAVEAARS